MYKATLNKFLIDRIHKDWIDRLYPEEWIAEDNIVKRGRERGHRGFDENIINPTA